LTRKQIIGVFGAGAGLLVLLVWLQLAPTLLGAFPRPKGDPMSRLAYAINWLVASGSTLLIGVWAASRRGFLAEAIDGTRTPSSHSLEINLRYNQNTLEQIVLAAIAWCSLSLDLPLDQMYLIPAMAFAFVVGRATFWIGYLVHPMGRAFGMVVTILPTICAYVWLGWRAATRH